MHSAHRWVAKKTLVIRTYLYYIICIEKRGMITMRKEDWGFKDYIEQLYALSEIIEVPGIQEAREVLIKELFQKFHVECEALGLKGK